MIAGTHSGCGKTTVACAVMRALVNRNINVSAFKCGPDYIDPMFHRTVTGANAYNLDSYLMDEDTVKYLLKKNSGGISVIEGVMGFYDGASFTKKGSSYEMSQITDTNVILVVGCRGMSLSAAALIKGFKEYEDNKIAGVIFNNADPVLFDELAKICYDIGVRPLGYMPRIKNAEIESRHLGLVTASEIEDLTEKADILARQAEESIDIDGILELSEADELYSGYARVKRIADVTVAVARDRAFCFYYEDNLELLRELGAETVYFSPLKNEPVPECDGILIGGGYPELYADILEKNTVSRNSLREAIKRSIPCIAECGGFMYLHEIMEDNNGAEHNMTGVIRGACRKTDRLVRFGYMEMTAVSDNILCKEGHKIKSREFHYFDSDRNGNGFLAEKNGKTWECVNTENNLFAGFAHIHFYSDVSLAENFIKSCLGHKESV